MAKITISRLLETSKILATKSGQELQDMITYFGDFSEQTLRNLRNGLTFFDNFNCSKKSVSLVHNTPQVVNTDGRSPYKVETTYQSAIPITGFGWYFNDKGETVVTALFSGSPTAAQNITLVIFFG